MTDTSTVPRPNGPTVSNRTLTCAIRLPNAHEPRLVAETDISRTRSDAGRFCKLHGGELVTRRLFTAGFKVNRRKLRNVADKKTPSMSVAAILLTLSACASNQPQWEARESLLLKSGFTMKPADTVTRQAALARLPANQFLERSKDGRRLYIYADPSHCSCIYIGDVTAYDQYQSALIEYQSGRDDPGVEGARHESIDNYKADGRAAIDAGIEDFGPL